MTSDHGPAIYAILYKGAYIGFAAEDTREFYQTGHVMAGADMSLSKMGFEKC